MGALIFFLTITALIYLFHRLGLLSLLALFILIILCLELAIVIVLMLCPEIIRNYLFFSGELNTLFASIPNEIMNMVKVKALNPIAEVPLGDTLTTLPEKLKEAVLSNGDKQLETLQTILEESKKNNVLTELQLEQFFNAKKVDLDWYNIVKQLLDTQTKSIVYAVNHPSDVVTQLNGIYNVSKPNLALLQESRISNSLGAQNNKILLEGFSNLMSLDGTRDISKQFNDLGQHLDMTLRTYQAQAAEISTKTEEALNTAMDTFQQNQIKLETNALERVQEAQAEAEERMQAAGAILESYQNNESYQQVQKSNSSVYNSTLPGQETVEAAATGGTLYAIGRAAFRLIFKI